MIRKILIQNDEVMGDVLSSLALAVYDMRMKLGKVPDANLILGMQHQLGIVAGRCMDPEAAWQEQVTDLMALATIAILYATAGSVPEGTT